MRMGEDENVVLADEIDKKMNSSTCSTNHVVGKEEEGKDVEKAALIVSMAECRICQEEDHFENMETPCACRGSLKYAHRKCVQHWCNEKGDTRCEICHEQYKSGYTAPPRTQPDEAVIDVSDGWPIAGTPFDLHDPRLLAMAAAQRHLLESEYDDDSGTNTSGASFLRSLVLILMVLLLLRHALALTNADGDDDDPSTYFTLFLLRAVAFFLPCYVMAWAISILQQRRQRQEAAALAASEVAYILQSTDRRGMHISIASESPAIPQQEPQTVNQ